MLGTNLTEFRKTGRPKTVFEKVEIRIVLADVFFEKLIGRALVIFQHHSHVGIRLVHRFIQNIVQLRVISAGCLLLKKTIMCVYFFFGQSLAG